jgi:hypothetical protein
MTSPIVVSLGPAAVDLTGIRAGDQNILSMTIHSKGTPLNLTGKTITAQARSTPLATTAIDAVITVVDAVGGQITIAWPGVTVATMLAGQAKWSGVWDIQMSAPGQDAVTLAAGKFGAVMDVTRP